LRQLPFVRRTDRTYAIHGLVAAHLVREHMDRLSIVGGRAADAPSAAGEYIAAARVAFAAGQIERAIDALEPGTMLLSAPPEEVADLAEVIDPKALVRMPRLWNMAILYRA